MTCANCGADNLEFAVYCSQCGNRLSKNQPEEQPVNPPQATPPQPPTPYYPAERPLPRGNGVIILVLGILSLVFCMPLGIVAWIMGNNDLQRMRAGYISRDDEAITQAGKILGIITTIFLVMIFLGIILFIFFIARLGSINPWEYRL